MEKEGLESLWSSVAATSMGSLGVSLEGASVDVASATAWIGGQPGFKKNSRGSGSTESCVPSGTSGWSP